MEWSATCDTLHAHTQVLGKLAVALAPPEPHLQHAAIDCTRPGRRSRSRRPTAPARSSAGLDLRLPEASLDHSDGRMQCVALMPNRPVDEVARGIVGAARSLGGPVEIDPTPQEVSWSVPLDEDDEHATYDGDGGFVLRLRDPRRARAGRVSGSFDADQRVVGFLRSRSESVLRLALRSASVDFIMRNAMDAQEVAVAWWPGDHRYGRATIYAYAHPAPDGFGGARLVPATSRWDGGRRNSSLTSLRCLRMVPALLAAPKGHLRPSTSGHLLSRHSA